jgi:hypothetical protein
MMNHILISKDAHIFNGYCNICQVKVRKTKALAETKPKNAFLNMHYIPLGVNKDLD